MVARSVLLLSLLAAVVTAADFDGSTFLTANHKTQLLTWAGTSTRGTWTNCYSTPVDSVYSASHNTAYHSGCDNKGPIFSVVKHNGFIFGGYQEESPGTSYGYGIDDKAYLFSLDTNSRWFGTPGHANNVYVSSSHAPSWGSGHDFTLGNGNRYTRNYYLYQRPPAALHSSDTGTGIYFFTNLNASIEYYYLAPRTDSSLNFRGSTILNDEQRYQLLSWDRPNQGFDVEWTLCYKSASVEFDSTELNSFQSGCGNQGRTFTVARVDGYTFGGYTSVSWGLSCSWHNDLTAYIFSLDYYRRTGVGLSGNKVYSCSNYMPTWGTGVTSGHDLFFGYSGNYNNRHTVRGTYSRNPYFLHPLDNSQYQFHARNIQLEVFKVAGPAEFATTYAAVPDFAGSTFLTEAMKRMMVTWAASSDKGTWTNCYSTPVNSVWSSSHTTGYHSGCDHKGGIFTVVKYNGFTFGGYQEESAGPSYTYVFDDNAYLFSLDKSSRYFTSIGHGNAIYLNAAYGPTWGHGHDMVIGDGSNRYTRTGYAYPRPTGALHSSDNGYHYFTSSPASIEYYYLQPRSTASLSFVGSNILTDAMRTQLLQWDQVTSGNTYRWSLCYKMDSTEMTSTELNSFHSGCDDKGRTFTVGRMNGFTFGGYAGVSWTGNCAYINDQDAYIFALDKMSRVVGSQALNTNRLYSCSTYMPTWGGHDIFFGYTNNINYRYTNRHPTYPRYTNFLHDRDSGTYEFNQRALQLEVYVASASFGFGLCGNGTAVDPQVALAPPALSPPVIANNNYELKIEADRRFDRVRVVFGDNDTNTCNFDSDEYLTGSSDWSVADGAVDPQCGTLITFSKAFQSMVAASAPGCQFVRSDTATDAVFRQSVNIITNQTRSIQYQQGYRNQTYTEIKQTFYHIVVSVPLTVTVTSGAVNVTGNITVLQAVSNLAVAYGSPYKVSFNLLTSSQAPYKLTYNSFTSPAALGNSITQNDPDCADTDPVNSCVQTFQFSDLDIVTGCPTKSTLNDAMTVTFDVGCKPLFTGNCITPSPAQITVSFTLQSTAYCPQIEDITLSAEMKTYRDVSLSDTNAWGSGLETSQFVIGSTIFGQVTVTVGENAATLDTTSITSINTIGPNGQVTSVYTTGGGGVGGTAVANGGGSAWPQDNEQARFSIPLTHGQTVDLDGVTDAAQTVTIQAVMALTYTTAGLDDASSVLQTIHSDTHGRSVRVSAQENRVSNVYGSVSLTSGVTDAAPAPSASSSSSMSVMTVGAVGAALVLLVVAAAYKAGRRAPSEKDIEAQDQDDSVMMHTIKSSSSVGLGLDSTSAGDEQEPEQTEQAEPAP